MIAQLDLFAATPPPVAVRRPEPVASEAKSSNNGTCVHFSDDGRALVLDDAMPAWRRARRDGREIVAVAPKRLRSRFDGSKEGDVRASYSAQSLCEDGRVTAPFRLRGQEWVQTSGLYCEDGHEFECFRIVALEAFEGAQQPARRLSRNARQAWQP